MADNLTALANTGTGTDVLATDEIAGVHYPRAKIGFGEDGSYADVSASNPVPVTVSGAVEIANDSGSPVPVSGPLTDAQLRDVPLPVTLSGPVEIANDSGSPLPVSGPLTNEQLRAGAVPVDVSGELVEAIEALRMAVQALTRSGLGQTMPDTAARLRVVVDAISASLTLATVTTVGTVSTVSTLTNQTQIGGLAATEQIPSLMRLGADSMRRNISVT